MSLSFARMQRSSSKALEPCNQTSQVHSRTRGACTCEVWLHGSSVFALERCIRLKAFSQIFATSAWTTPSFSSSCTQVSAEFLRTEVGLRSESVCPVESLDRPGVTLARLVGSCGLW